METKTFGAEAKQLLDLMIHSVYSNKEIFLRELVSNASDALDKRRFLALTEPALLDKDTPLEITLKPDAAARTLTLSDNGVGMSQQEVVDNIGTIAKSGTREMLQQHKKDGKGDAPELIGQFGVGFYSAFMVADRVELVTRRAGQTTATRWVSTGDGTYGIEPAEKAEVGTTITLHLKPVDTEDGVQDYTNTAVLEDVVRKHSDFVTHPIVIGEGAEKRTLNSMKPIWARRESEVTEREYAEFYRHITHDWGSPLKTIAFKAEGTFEYQALLFVPEHAPFDLYYRDGKRGLQLYVKKVLIMEQCEALLPSYLRFVRGVVDSQDLPLNVSRELLQENRQLAAIRKRLAKKVVDSLVQLAESDAPTYEKFYAEMGPLLKEGIAADGDNKEKLLTLLRFGSSAEPGKTTSLKDYVGRMKEGQEAIYYVSGESRQVVEQSPHLEAYKDQGFEVLFFTEAVDELLVSHVDAFEGKALRSVSKGACDLKTPERDAKTKEEMSHLCEHLQRALDKHVKEVRVSDRLRTSPVCLVGGEEDMSPHMERLLRQAQKGVPAQKRILEVNPEHEQIRALDRRLKEKRDDAVLKQYAELLYGQALLAEGSPLPEPAVFARLVGELVIRAEHA
ncbi:MAG: molecular chaperone HtpG [Deltaproteobacteria bacterium]|nr:molecular chaperone HtpG [Deltaproteobacteria bacterium]